MRMLGVEGDMESPMSDPQSRANVPAHTMWSLLLYSVRYAMGRQTGAPSDVADWVRAYRSSLTDWQIKQIAEEVAEELQRCEKKGHHLGAEIDHKTWTCLVADLRA